MHTNESSKCIQINADQKINNNLKMHTMNERVCMTLDQYKDQPHKTNATEGRKRKIK